MTKPLTDQHLHPLTLAFQQGLEGGTVSLDTALEFCNRVFDAYLEAIVRRHDEADAKRHAWALGGIITVPRNKEARQAD